MQIFNVVYRISEHMSSLYEILDHFGVAYIDIDSKTSVLTLNDILLMVDISTFKHQYKMLAITTPG